MVPTVSDGDEHLSPQPPSATAGLLLAVGTILALVVANSPLAPAYHALLHRSFAGLAAIHWINDGLMALFFLLVGLELKRELLVGALATTASRILPGAAAIAGMVVPALCYLALTDGDEAAQRGWAIPAATDIAFALAVVAALGARVPPALRVFLTAVAIVDDLGAIVVIGAFYTATLHLALLAAAGVGVLVLVGFNRAGVRSLTPYLLVGIGIWAAVHESGVHATLAGVAVALTVPLRDRSGGPSPLDRLEHRLAPLVGFLVVPVFGFANAGVAIDRSTMTALAAPIPVAIVVALVFGKQAGVFTTIWAARPAAAGGTAGRHQLAAAARCRLALRHRFHHEPVYCRTRVRRRERQRYHGQARHPDRLAGVGRRRLFRAADRALMRVRYFNFWLFLATMVLVTVIAGLRHITPERATLLGFDAGALVFIVGTLRLMRGAATDDMRQRAAANDPDAHVLIAVSMLIVGVVLVAVTVELTGLGGGHGTGLAIAGVTILLAWVFSNLLFALHYAHRFYAPGDAGDDPGRGDGAKQDTGGLQFPGDEMPVYSDFAYFSFVLGMTFQVSDVVITSRGLRRFALYHAMAAFLFNIIVVALSVSLIGGLLQK